jgi:hypothetical protein
MTAPAVVAAGMRLWAERWLPWGLLTLLFSGVVSVLLAAVDPQPALTNPAAWPVPSEAEPGTTATAILLSSVATLLLGPWLYVILARASLLVAIEGAPNAGVDRTIRGVPSVLWLFVLLVLGLVAALIPVAVVGAVAASPMPSDAADAIVVAGAIAFVLLGLLWLLPRLVVLIHVFVAEDRRGRHAIAETWRRTKGAWWMSLGVVVLNLLIGMGFGIVPTSIANNVFPLATMSDAVPRAVILALTNALVTPIGLAITAALYLELSARKGLLSQATVRRNLSRFDA